MPSGCPIPALVADLGRYFADSSDPNDIATAGVVALRRGLNDLDELMATAYAPHEVVAAELLVDAGHRSSRTVFPGAPGPVPLLLLCARLCEPGDEVTLVQRTANRGTCTERRTWPFGVEAAEQLTRPPAIDRHGPAGAILPAPAGPGGPPDAVPVAALARGDRFRLLRTTATQRLDGAGDILADAGLVPGVGGTVVWTAADGGAGLIVLRGPLGVACLTPEAAEAVLVLAGDLGAISL